MTFERADDTINKSFVSQGIEKGFDEVDYSQVVADGIIGGISGRKNGLANGTAKHLMNQGIQGTKRILQTGQVGKAAKYYVSQTYKLFYEPHLRELPGRIFSDTIVNYGKESLYALY